MCWLLIEEINLNTITLGELQEGSNIEAAIKWW